MNIIELTNPPYEPLSLQDVYDHLRLDPEGSPSTHPHDAMLTTMIKTARMDAERVTGRCFVERRIRQTASSFYDDLTIQKVPYISGSLTVKYYDGDNVLQTLASTNYIVIEDTFLPQVIQSQNGSWPVTYLRPDAVRLEYTAGYEAQGSPADATGYRYNIPSTILDAMKIRVQLLYDELTPDKRQALERTYELLLANNWILTL